MHAVKKYLPALVVLNMVPSPHASEPHVQQTFVELELAAISLYSNGKSKSKFVTSHTHINEQWSFLTKKTSGSLTAAMYHIVIKF